ncbi:hypothetical protein GCM10009410_21390 [Shewanella ulleungensis]|uniref:Uncharacterized protein n=1 Tax=Shewanella ulleungensis TaxID=2282699 RepID=A0ABQ2QMV7_9GAMM|nr:hypothetical protein GCM10009410_21390 [Shewanella ulleungensis]
MVPTLHNNEHDFAMYTTNIRQLNTEIYRFNFAGDRSIKW